MNDRTRDQVRPRRALRPTLLVAGLLVAGTLTTATGQVAPSTAAPPSGARTDGDVVHTRSVSGPADARAVRETWTPARMRAATPRDLTVGADAADQPVPPSGSGGGTVTLPYDAPTLEDAAERAGRRVRVPSTAGKLFFTNRAGTPFVCSAAAINTRRKNQVITAGHCVHSGNGGRWFRNFLFVPRYDHGSAPDGQWVGKAAWAFRGWTRNGRFGYDQAIVSFERLAGRRLVKVVGGNGIDWGRTPRQRGVRIWGWPAEAPYDGESARRCEGRTTPWRRTNDAKMRCPMNGGASGGPWLLRKHRRVNVGTIFAVTSRRTTAGTPYLLARPLPKAIRNLVRQAN